MNIYRIKKFFFNWNAETEEEGGSIVLTFCKVIHFVKYKQGTIIHFGKNRYKEARKYVKAYNEI